MKKYSKDIQRIQKDQTKIVKSFLEWCEASRITPNEDAVNKYPEANFAKL
ncbi:MAG: hypothetical protein QXL96_02665 [Ignisphaera sp.]